MNLVGGLRIEIAGGLIGQHQARMQHHRARHGDALLLAAGKLGWPAMKLVGQAHQLQHLAGAPRGLAFRHPRDQPRHHHVLQRGEVGEQVMKLENEAELEVAKVGQRPIAEREQVLALEIDLACGRRLEASEHVEQSRFAYTRLPHDRDFFARPDLHLEPAQHADFAVGVEEALVQRLGSQQELPAAWRRDRCSGLSLAAAFAHSARSLIANDLDRRERARLEGRVERAPRHSTIAAAATARKFTGYRRTGTALTMNRSAGRWIR